jgi:hypothetical protein
VSKSSSSSSGGVGFGGLLFLVFLVLKLTGVIAWSWWWVTAPLWVPFLLLILIFAVGGFTVGVLESKAKKDRERRRNLR